MELQNRANDRCLEKRTARFVYPGHAGVLIEDKDSTIRACGVRNFSEMGRYDAFTKAFRTHRLQSFGVR